MRWPPYSDHFDENRRLVSNSLEKMGVMPTTSVGTAPGRLCPLSILIKTVPVVRKSPSAQLDAHLAANKAIASRGEGNLEGETASRSRNWERPANSRRIARGEQRHPVDAQGNPPYNSPSHYIHTLRSITAGEALMPHAKDFMSGGSILSVAVVIAVVGIQRTPSIAADKPLDVKGPATASDSAKSPLADNSTQPKAPKVSQVCQTGKEGRRKQENCRAGEEAGRAEEAADAYRWRTTGRRHDAIAARRNRQRAESPWQRPSFRRLSVRDDPAGGLLGRQVHRLRVGRQLPPEMVRPHDAQRAGGAGRGRAISRASCISRHVTNTRGSPRCWPSPPQNSIWRRKSAIARCQPLPSKRWTPSPRRLRGPDRLLRRLGAVG